MNASASHLQHDISIHFNPATMAGAAFVPPGWPPGASARILRRFESGHGVRSALVKLPPAWTSGATVCATTCQVFVLSGQIAVGTERLTERAFLVRKAGRPFSALATETGAELLMIFDTDPSYTAASSTEVATVLHRDILLDVPGRVPVINGIEVTGFARRTLWEHPDTGADTRHLTIGPFEGKGPNWHPVHEEIYCLSGCIGPDDRRILRAGCYLHNPAFGVHGYREHSADGATLLEWHDGPWQLNYVR